MLAVCLQLMYVNLSHYIYFTVVCFFHFNLSVVQYYIVWELCRIRLPLKIQYSEISKFSHLLNAASYHCYYHYNIITDTYICCITCQEHVSSHKY
jgi:hypothetical protein